MQFWTHQRTTWCMDSHLFVSNAWIRKANTIWSAWKNGSTLLHMILADFDKKEAALKITPIMDALGFIAAISNTGALAWALFTSTSPLTQDLHELYKTVIEGYHNGELDACKPYATGLVCTCTVESLYRHCKILQKMIHRRWFVPGVPHENPLTDYIWEISRYTSMYSSGPPCAYWFVQNK